MRSRLRVHCVVERNKAHDQLTAMHQETSNERIRRIVLQTQSLVVDLREWLDHRALQQVVIVGARCESRNSDLCDKAIPSLNEKRVIGCIEGKAARAVLKVGL